MIKQRTVANAIVILGVIRVGISTSCSDRPYNPDQVVKQMRSAASSLRRVSTSK